MISETGGSVIRQGPGDVAGCAICIAGRRPAEALIFENALWIVRRGDGTPGDVLVQTRRHSPGIAQFNDAEAASFGPTFRHICGVLLELTGALRIYMSVVAENNPHFHTHLIPKHAVMPDNATTFDVFKLAGSIRAGRISVDAEEVERVNRDLRKALEVDPPPR